MKPEGNEITFPGESTQGMSDLALSADARMSQYLPDGSVDGSYSRSTMDQLLHYHNLDGVRGAGYAALAGERIEL